MLSAPKCCSVLLTAGSDISDSVHIVRGMTNSRTMTLCLPQQAVERPERTADLDFLEGVTCDHLVVLPGAVLILHAPVLVVLFEDRDLGFPVAVIRWCRIFRDPGFIRLRCRPTVAYRMTTNKRLLIILYVWNWSVLPVDDLRVLTLELGRVGLSPLWQSSNLLTSGWGASGSLGAYQCKCIPARTGHV